MDAVDKIKNKIESDNLTYRDVAQRTGVNLRTIHDFLKGEGNPTLKTLDRLQVGLGLAEGKRQ